jgi:hypothetical protein
MGSAGLISRDERRLPATPLRVLSPFAARVMLAAAALAFAALVLVAAAYRDPPPAHAGDGDLALYGRIVARLHAGGAYYPSAHAELLTGHYGTLSVPAWRAPLYLTVVSLFPSVAAAQAALVLLSLIAAAAATILILRTAGRPAAVAMIPVLLVALSGCLAPGSVLFSEYACGTLIMLSATCFALDRREIGFGAGALALFFRELALPYVLVCIFVAWRQGRRGEAAAWLVALIAYAAYYAWHYHMVLQQLGPGDAGTAEGWLRFGGASFVLSTAAFAGVLALCPLTVAAAFLVLGTLGLLAWPDGDGRRIPLTVFTYLLAFAVVGKPLDRYWGEIYTPLLALGLVWALPALRDLASAAASRKASA